MNLMSNCYQLNGPTEVLGQGSTAKAAFYAHLRPFIMTKNQNFKLISIVWCCQVGAKSEFGYQQQTVVKALTKLTQPVAAPFSLLYLYY